VAALTTDTKEIEFLQLLQFIHDGKMGCMYLHGFYLNILNAVMHSGFDESTKRERRTSTLFACNFNSQYLNS
jgi:hypothetical protein